MTVRLAESKSTKGIPINDMRNGQVGRAVVWDDDENHCDVGDIVQRDGNDLAIWGDRVYVMDKFTDGDRVEILSDGIYRFEITDNE